MYKCIDCMNHRLRYLVGLLYAVYAAVIVTALTSDHLPVRWTVLTCLSIHFAGVLGGLLHPNLGWNYVYPEDIRFILVLWDIVQFIFLWLLCFSEKQDGSAYIALFGVGLCFFKLRKVTQ